MEPSRRVSAMDPLAEARAHLKRGDVAAAEAACEALLRESAADPIVLELAAACETAAGRPLEAVRLLLRAVRALAGSTATPTTAVGIWTALNSAFVDALSGQDAHAANARRHAYRKWLKHRASGERHQGIAVVLLVPGYTTADAVLPTFQSIATQTRRPTELVVVALGRAPALDALRVRADLLPFDVRWVESPTPSKAAALEAAVAASREPWIVAVEPHHTFAPGHLQALGGRCRSGRRAVGLHRLHACSRERRRPPTDGRGTYLARRDADVAREGGECRTRIHRSVVSGRRRRCGRFLAPIARGVGRLSITTASRAVGFCRSRDARGRAGPCPRGDVPACRRGGRAAASPGRA